MSNNKAKKKSYQAVLASVKKEMAGPRVAESAQIKTGRHGAAALKGVAKSA